jgi:hypothetical protein
MKFWNKDMRQEAEKRVAKMETHALLSWLDSVTMMLGSSIDSWKYHGGAKSAVDEALMVVQVIWEELSKRNLDF